jgi:F0F1-type ATP synthase membrane subunit b/b'
MQLTPDISILFQIAIFLAVFAGLRALVFTPMQQVLADRHRRTVESEHSAEVMIETAQGDRARYDEAVHQRRLQLAREAEAARHAAIEESNQAIVGARAAIAQELASQRAVVAAQVETARRALGAQAESIAAEMLQRVTGGARG